MVLTKERSGWMYFLIFEKTDNFFTELLGNFDFKSFLILLTGMIAGFIIFSAVYGVIVVRSLRDDEATKLNIKSINKPDDHDIENAIASLKVRFQEDSSGLNTGEKVEVLGQILLETLQTIASAYYPNSMYPLYELSVNEIIELNEYITKRVDGIFDKRILTPFRKMNIAQILKIVDYKKRIDEAKLVKAANKLKIPTFWKYTKMAINYANPLYWFKKLVIGSTFSIVIDKMALAIIDIVADETNKVYSKSIFNVESKLKTADIDSLIDTLAQEDNEG